MNITPTLITLDPKLLTTNQNVRKDLVLGKDFLASIKLHGVRSPIEAFPDPLLDGHYQVHTGHRRAAAALKAELPEVLVLVITAREAADRVTEQLIENLHRQELTPQDLAAGYHDLSLFGQSAMTIAKNTSSKLALVGDALRVAKAPTATKALEQYQLTIDDALVFAEFEDDPEALVELNRTATNEPTRIAHNAQVLRNERTDRAEFQIVVDAITKGGIAYLNEVPSYDDATRRCIGHLKDANGAMLTADEAIEAAGDDLTAYVSRTRDGYDQPATYSIGYAVANWASHGWSARYETSSTPSAGPLSEDEKAIRRRARENTKLWVAATTVRLNWLMGLVQGANPPAGWELLTTLHTLDSSGTNPSTWTTIATMLHLEIGKDSYSHRGAIRTHLESHPRSAPFVATAIALGAVEGGFEFDRKGWQKLGAIAHLQRLADWGYTLSSIEQSVIDGTITKGN